MCGPCTHDAAHILRVIGNRIYAKLRSIPCLELREEKLLWHARPTRGAQSIRQKVAARSWNCANNVTAPRMTQLMKKATHRTLHVEIADIQRVVLDELAAWLDDVAHQNREHFVGVDSVIVV